MTKRKYTLSDAALAQRRRVSPFAQKKRATGDAIARELPSALTAAIKDICRQESDALKLDIADHHRKMDKLDDYIRGIFAPLPKDAPNSEHQRRAALIRMHKIRNGELSGSSRGGRRKVSRSCTQCGESCDSAREARDHCRQTRKNNFRLVFDKLPTNCGQRHCVGFHRIHSAPEVSA